MPGTWPTAYKTMAAIAIKNMLVFRVSFKIPDNKIISNMPDIQT